MAEPTGSGSVSGGVALAARRAAHLDLPSLFAVVAIGIVQVTQLVVLPVVGLADNGDFQRIMGCCGLSYRTADPALRYFHFFTRRYARGHTAGGRYLSSTVLFTKAAVFLSAFGHHAFDIRMLGGIRIVACAIGVWLVCSGLRPHALRVRWLTAVLLVLMLADKGVFLYFNSFFSEGDAVVAMLVVVGAALHLASSGRTRWLVVFLVGTALLTTAKTQDAPFVIVLVPFAWVLTRAAPSPRRTTLLVGASLAVVGLSLAAVLTNPFGRINEYDMVFAGILQSSPTPAADLRGIGVHDEYAPLAGTNYYSTKPVDPTSAAFHHGFYTHVSSTTAAIFYLQHPARYLSALRATGRVSFIERFYLGTYEASAGKGADAQSHAFGQWTNVLGRLPRRLWFVALMLGTYLAGACVEWLRAPPESRGWWSVAAMIGVLTLLAFGVPVLGAGQADLGRHLLLFNVLFSFVLCATLVWLSAVVPPIARRRLGRSPAG